VTATRLAESADAQLDAALRQIGTDVGGPRRIRRWREDGLLPRLAKHGRGQGQGWYYEYPPDALEQARLINVMLHDEANLRKVALGLFAHRRYVRETTLRAAFKSLFQGTERWLTSFTASDDADERARTAADALLRKMERNGQLRAWTLRLGGTRPELQVTVRDALSGLFSLALGGNADPRSLQEFQRSSGLDEHLDNQALESLVEPLRAVSPAELAPHVTLATLEHAVEAAPLRDLDASRDHVLGICALLQATYGLDIYAEFESLPGNNFGPAIAFATALALSAGHALPRRMERTKAHEHANALH
jgi:hypothetical protein